MISADLIHSQQCSYEYSNLSQKMMVVKESLTNCIIYLNPSLTDQIYDK